jgi:omega-6 fatty acid desaturase (delta-12 desaturase)
MTLITDSSADTPIDTSNEAGSRTPRPGPNVQRDGSLNSVRAVIDERCYERGTARGVLAVVQATVLWLLPVVALAFTDTWYFVLPLWVLAGLGVSGMFVIGHDASHHALTESRRLNRVLAQICMGPSAHVEAAWDLGHNRIHHGYTTRQGFDFVWHPATADEYRAMTRYERLRHRLEWSWLGSGAYFLRDVWWNKMWRFNAPGKRRDAIVRDKITLGAAIVLALVGGAVLGALTGGWVAAIWVPFKLFVVPFLIFVQVIGFTVYVHHVSPEIRWWPKKEWTQFHGQMDSTTVLRIPRLVNVLWFHNIFVHVPHHVDARIRFDQLPRAAEQIAAAFPDTVRSARLSIREYLRATRACKLYDFERGCWLPYSAARP